MFETWIKTPGVDRCYVVEFQARVGDDIITLRRATHPYRSAPGDSPALTPYQDTILSMGTWGRELTELFTGYSTTARCTIELFMDDELAALIESADVGGLPVTVRCGDANWPLTDFGVVISAVADALTASSYDTAQLTLRDPSELLRRPLQSTLINVGPSAGQPVPICLGRCFNISPVLIDEATRKYQVHDGAIQAITAVRENGAVIPFTADVANGTFTLTNNAKGRVTADVDGAKPSGTWLQTAAQFITDLTGRFGLSEPEGLASLPGYLLGLYITGDKTLQTVLDDISASLNAAWYYSRQGVLRWYWFNGVNEPTQSLTADDIADDTLYPRRRIAPVKTVSLGYRKNWTPQADGLAGSVRETTPALAALFEKAESLATADNASQADNADAATITTSTLIVELADAQAEANRRAAWASVPRRIYELSAFAAPFALDLGATLSIDYPRYFTGGQAAVITRITDDLLADTATVEVIR
ncbi:hypothetical protein [Rheinheimera sp.]|uniref:hypothetical protein n=1 Tax=Rheinheimera sp. TaxID=1869214 RepID=UPI00307DC71D